MDNEYFNHLIKYFENSFDITSPFTYNNDIYDGIAVFHSHVDKYVLLQKAQLWACDGHEYCLFRTYDKAFTSDDFAKITRVLTEYMEPHFVRNDEKYPPKDHMYSYLSLFIICNGPIDKAAIKCVKKFKFTKFYKLYTRGYSEAHIVLVDVSNHKIYNNSAAKCKRKLMNCIFKDLV